MTIIPIIFTIFAILLFVHGVSAGVKDDIELDEHKKENELWLQQELEKPKYRIIFNTLDCNTYYISGFFPKNSCVGSSRNRRYTSKRLANICMEISYERGYFRDDNGVTIPVGQILNASVIGE